MKETIMVILFAAVAGFILYGNAQVEGENPQGIWAEIAETRADPEWQAKQAAEDAAFDQYAPTVVIAILVFLLVLIFGGMAAESKHAKEIFIWVIGLAILGGMLYLGVYGDKTGDGQGDTQIVAMVQPDGDQPNVDLKYAAANELNSRSNVNSSIALIIVIFAVCVFVLVISFVAFVFKGSEFG